MFNSEIFYTAVKIAVMCIFVMGTVPLTVWFERRGAGWIQGRPGPNRVGPFGLLQPLADIIKLITKESFIPKNANKFFYLFAPLIVPMFPLAAWVAIPFGSSLIIGGDEIPLKLINLSSGVLLSLAFAGLEVYPLMLGAWAANNKYTNFGALRGASQMVSYEIAMGLSLVSMLLIYGSFDLDQMVHFQHQRIIPGVQMMGALMNPVAFIIFLISIFAETNRLPFDLPEGENEIVGYHAEYGSSRFALFFFAEYMAMTMGAGLLVTIFLGGYNAFSFLEYLVPTITNWFSGGEIFSHNLLASMQMLSFFIKVSSIMFLFVWVRWSLPRFRYDQLMHLGWRILFPISLINLMVVAIVLYFKGA